MTVGDATEVQLLLLLSLLPHFYPLATKCFSSLACAPLHQWQLKVTEAHVECLLDPTVDILTA